jgi:hypothetical protein
VEFYIINDDACPILGLKTCKELNIISRVNEITSNSGESMYGRFHDVYDDGIGKLPFIYDIKLEGNAVSKVIPARVNPNTLNDTVREEINKMMEGGIFKEVSEPTDWVHPIVIAKKPNGKDRICIGPRNLISKGNTTKCHFSKKFSHSWKVKNISVFWMLLQHFKDFKKLFFQLPWDP